MPRPEPSPILVAAARARNRNEVEMAKGHHLRDARQGALSEASRRPTSR